MTTPVVLNLVWILKLNMHVQIEITEQIQLRHKCFGQVWIGVCVRPDAWTTVLVRSQHLVRQVSPIGKTEHVCGWKKVNEKPVSL